MHTEQEQRDVHLRKEDQDIFRFIGETRAEVGALRDGVIRLSASTMWEPGSVLTDGVQVIPQERLRARIAELYLSPSVSPAKEDTAGVVQGPPPERDQKRIAEQSVHFPVFPTNLSSVPSVPTMFPAKWRMKRATTWSPLVSTRKEPVENPRSSPSKVLTGSQASRGAATAGRGLCGQCDSGENVSSTPQRHPRIPSTSAEKPRLADPALVNAKLTRVKADGMQTPAAESCIQEEVVVFPDQQTQGRLCLTATHIVEDFIACAQAGMNDNPADLQLISRICGTFG